MSTDYTPFDPPPRREPVLEHVRDLWTLRGITSSVTAAIWRNDFGLELLVENNSELVESSLSRYGEAPLLPDRGGRESESDHSSKFSVPCFGLATK